MSGETVHMHSLDSLCDSFPLFYSSLTRYGRMSHDSSCMDNYPLSPAFMPTFGVSQRLNMALEPEDPPCAIKGKSQRMLSDLTLILPKPCSAFFDRDIGPARG